MTMDRPGQVWCADITFVPMRRGYMYLAVVTNWCSRRVRCWRSANALEAGYRIEALEDAAAKHGNPAHSSLDHQTADEAYFRSMKNAA